MRLLERVPDQCRLLIGWKRDIDDLNVAILDELEWMIVSAWDAPPYRRLPGVTWRPDRSCW